jgi:regulator of sirC expression with transglutaminase-like and TPR domain
MIQDFTPLCCDQAAFLAMRHARERLDTLDGLIDGAMAIARHDDPDVDCGAARQALYAIADDIRGSVRGSQPQALVAHLHDRLFVEHGFIGNTINYHDPANSYLPSVVEHTRGLPITLSLVYKIVGERAGLNVRGIGLPGHFCAGVELDGSIMIVDPFYAGRVLNVEEAQDRIRDTYGPNVEWSDELLEPVTYRHWLTRIMQNLLHTFGAQDRMRDVAAMLELELLLWPEQTHLQRDLALVLARTGHVGQASLWLSRYLNSNPQDPQRADLEQLLQVLSA